MKKFAILTMAVATLGLVACGDDTKDDDNKASVFTSMYQELHAGPKSLTRGSIYTAQWWDPSLENGLWVGHEKTFGNLTSDGLHSEQTWQVVFVTSGTSHSMGDVYCSFDLTNGLSAVEGFETKTRVKKVSTAVADTCGVATIGETADWLIHITERNTTDDTIAKAIEWPIAATDDEDPDLGTEYGGTGLSWEWCPEADRDAAGFCPYDCLAEGNSDLADQTPGSRFEKPYNVPGCYE